MAINPIDRALALLPKLSGTLSVCGSIFILQDVLRDEKKRKDSVYHRIMFGLSIFDGMSSIASIASTWPTPSHQSDAIFLATGTTATCTAQGFFAELGNLTTVTYTAALTLRYVLIICYNLSEQQLQRYEPLFHGLPILLGMAMAVAGLPLDLYNNSGWLCWYAPYPRNCDLTDTCQRGALAPLFRWIHYSMVWIAILCVTFGMIYIYWTVRRQEARALAIRGISDGEQEGGAGEGTQDSSAVAELQNTDKCSFIQRLKLDKWQSIGRSLLTNSDRSSSAGVGHKNEKRKTSSIISGSTNSTFVSQQPKRELKRSKEVAAQARLYIFAMYLTWLFTTVARFYQIYSSKKPYTALLLMAIFFPLQGFWNCIIYVRPRFVQRRQERERESSRNAMLQQQQSITMSSQSQENISSLDTMTPSNNNNTSNGTAESDTVPQQSETIPSDETLPQR